MTCLLCQSKDEVQAHHVAAGMLEITVPLCDSCHRIQTGRQHQAGVFRALRSESEIAEACSFVAGCSGLLIELARATGAPDLVRLHERQQRALLRLLSTLDIEAPIGPAPIKGGPREHPEPAVTLGEDDAQRSARAIFDAVCDGAREWLGHCPPVGDLAGHEAGLLSDLEAFAESLARTQLTGREPEPEVIRRLAQQMKPAWKENRS
jgi:hypothetical protein